MGSVVLTTRRTGRGEHLALCCPGCDRGDSVFYNGCWGLRCAACSRRLARPEHEQALAAWRSGEPEEDRLLRAVAKGGSLKPFARRLDAAIRADDRRVVAAFRSFQAAVAMVRLRTLRRR